MNVLSRSIRWVARRFGYNMVRCQASSGCPVDFDKDSIATINAVRPFTKTSPERIYTLCKSVRHVIEQDIPGDFVECGVWRGGSMMAVARTLVELGVTDRTLYLFDTYQGMTAPTEDDISKKGVKAEDKFRKRELDNGASDWCFASIEDVRANMLSTGYPENQIRFVKGKVEDTLPDMAPSEICLLRLDTDWYESTRHELQQLYPRLNEGGFLIIDDYGDWLGARKAVDEYIDQNHLPLFLHRVDDTARLAVKPASSGRAAA